MIAGVIGTVIKRAINFITVVMFIFVVSILSDYMCRDADVVFAIPFAQLSLPPGRIHHLSAIHFAVLRGVVELPFVLQG